MQTWILLAVRVGVVLTVLALGLRTGWDSATYLFRRPGKLAKALLAMNVVMPLFIALMIAVSGLHLPVAIVLMALAISPIPPILPKKVGMAGGSASYMMGLLVAASLLAIVFVPMVVALLGKAFGTRVDVSWVKIATMVVVTVLAPVSGGLVVHHLAPAFAERASKPASIAGLVLLVGGMLPILVAAMPTVVRLIGNGTLLAIVAFTLVGLAAGHLLGGPDPDERTDLAFTTASRHPGVAFVLASAVFPEKKQVVAALLLYLLVSAIVSIPYQLWAKHRHAKLAHAAAR